jgi:hypothetical protein
VILKYLSDPPETPLADGPRKSEERQEVVVLILVPLDGKREGRLQYVPGDAIDASQEPPDHVRPTGGPDFLERLNGREDERTFVSVISMQNVRVTLSVSKTTVASELRRGLW